MPDGVVIPGGPSFSGSPQPPDVPCDPTGEGWRGPPGPPTPVKQHIQVTFTPQQAGRMRGYVRLGKASTTVWINPQIIIA